MENKLYIMIGVAGSGKTTRAWQHVGDEHAKVFSSDDYREEMYSSLSEGNRHNDEVFRSLHKDLLTFLSENNGVTAVYDATNLNRKRRRGIYEQFSKYATVIAEVVYVPLQVALANNAPRTGDKRVPDYVIKKMYLSMQPPRVGVDCDEVKLVSEPYEPMFYADMLMRNIGKGGVTEVKDLKHYADNLLYYTELYKNYTEHDSPYHLESVDEHISLTIANAPNRMLQEIAVFHDLGKGLAKAKREDGYYSFICHENVGAMYAFVAAMSSIVSPTRQRLLSVSEVVLHHMQANRGELAKATKMDRLSEQELQLLEEFSAIDKASRVTGG